MNKKAAINQHIDTSRRINSQLHDAIHSENSHKIVRQRRSEIEDEPHHKRPHESEPNNHSINEHQLQFKYQAIALQILQDILAFTLARKATIKINTSSRHQPYLCQSSSQSAEQAKISFSLSLSSQIKSPSNDRIALPSSAKPHNNLENECTLKEGHQLLDDCFFPSRKRKNSHENPSNVDINVLMDNKCIASLQLTFDNEKILGKAHLSKAEEKVFHLLSSLMNLPKERVALICETNVGILSQAQSDTADNDRINSPDVFRAIKPHDIISTGMFANIDLSKEHPALSKALLYISQHFRDNFSMKELANECYVSPSHLSSLLKQRFNLSFKKILTHMRIEQAKHIFLSMPSRQITQVCIDVGFSDLSHFEKTFKRYEGMSPSNYRKSHKPKSQKLSIHL